MLQQLHIGQHKYKDTPLIEENPIKCLGKWYDSSLKDRGSVSRTEKQTEEWLLKIKSSGLPGKFKTWLFQHGLLPRHLGY